MTEAMIEVELQRVVAAVAYGEPRPCVGQRRVRFWRSRRDVIRTGRNRSARQSGGKDAGINRWARRRWANSRNRLVGVNTDKLDSLMDVVGELVIVQSQLLETARAAVVPAGQHVVLPFWGWVCRFSGVGQSA